MWVAETDGPLIKKMPRKNDRDDASIMAFLLIPRFVVAAAQHAHRTPLRGTARDNRKSRGYSANT